MNHEHAECPRVQYARLQPDVKHYELDKAFARHERADGPRLAHVEPEYFGGGEAGNELGEEGNGANKDDVAPSYAIVEQAEVGAQARECEVLAKQIMSVQGLQGARGDKPVGGK